MSKQNDILEALRARLGQIRLADGYATDIGATVFRGRRAISPDHPPCCSIFEHEDEIEKQSPGTGAIHTAPVAFESLPVSIEAHAACDPDHPNVTAHAMVADIKRAIFGGDLTWGTLATHTQYVGRNVGDRDAGTDIAFAQVLIKIGCVEDLANP